MSTEEKKIEKLNTCFYMVAIGHPTGKYMVIKVPKQSWKEYGSKYYRTWAEAQMVVDERNGILTPVINSKM